MKNFPLISLFFFSIIFFNACNKDVSEPKQKAKGCNLVYLKVNDSEEFLLDDRSKLIHKNTASDLDNKKQVRYGEISRNNKILSQFDIPFQRKDKKAEFKYGRIFLEIDPETQQLDTSFLRNSIRKDQNSYLRFAVEGVNPREFFVDSILDYKIIKWDKENKIFTFSANATYQLYPSDTTANHRLYFYLDVKY